MPAETSFASLAERHLGPVLTRAGFAPGQWGAGQRVSQQLSDTGWESVVEPWAESGTYCTGAVDYIQRHPHLIAGRADPYGGHDPRACLDIVVEGTLERGVLSIKVEFEDLTDLLAGLGRPDDAAAVRDAIDGGDCVAALRAIAAVLQRLYPTT